jgi:sulfatase modifying factor 1
MSEVKLVLRDATRLRILEIERRVCDIVSTQLRIPRNQVSPTDRLIEDLHCDSVELMDLFMELEDAFDVILTNQAPNPVYKAVFTRQPFRLCDLAELIYLQQGTGVPNRNRGRSVLVPSASTVNIPFTQLDGRFDRGLRADQQLLEPLDPDGGSSQFRRRSDGMRCVRIPGAEVEIGSDASESHQDERPKHLVEIDAFVIDAEPVSTTAYCRFLNSIGDTAPEILSDWFILDPSDDRNLHVLIEHSEKEWRPVAGTEKWPMMLVSWYGANSYSLWANGWDWTAYRDAEGIDGAASCLPSEAQWEYAARGAQIQSYPWGDAPPLPQAMRYGQHDRCATYKVETLPLASVNEQLGMSPFGLHHAAGNVWQWCRDWYDQCFYQKPESRMRNPLNRTVTGIRSERGGSWVGPAELCRSSFRRGRAPSARGRCLGFRCTTPIA